MKKYRFYHWLGLFTTETYIKANSKDEAIEKFKERYGEDLEIILNIECCDD